MADFFYEKQESPDAYVLDVTPGTSGADLSLVSSAHFRILRGDFLIETWSAAITNQTTTTITLTHVLAAGGLDLPERGTYVIFARLEFTGGGGFSRTSPNELIIKGEFEV